MAEARAIWFQASGQAAILKEKLPELKPGMCQLETLFSGISLGTERLVFSGRVPEELHQEMKCPYMAGEFSFPLKYGYSLVAKITEGPEEKKGQIVHVLHPHQDRCMVRIEDTYVLPEKVPPQRATLASNLETAVNAVWDSRAALGERALIVGFGIIGSLVAQVLSFVPGVEVKIMDTNPSKLSLAEKLGFQLFDPENSSESFDMAFHASGTFAGLQLAIDKVGFEGRVIEISWYGEQRVSLHLGGSFHSQRKTIISSQVSHIPAHLSRRWDKTRRKEFVFELLERSEFDAHITHCFPFSQLPEIYPKLFSSPGEGLGYLIEYEERKNHV